MTDKKLQEFVKEKRESWGFGSQDTFILLCGLTAELGELADILKDTLVHNKPLPPEDDKSSLKHEMADVYIFLSALATKHNIDLEAAVLSKIKLNDKRFGFKV